MRDGFRRFSILCFVFAFFFFGVYIFRNYDSEQGIKGLFNFSGDTPGVHRPESYTLQSRPAVNLSDVQILSAFDSELAKLTSAVVPSVVAIDTAGIKEQAFLDTITRRRVIQRSNVTGLGSGVIVTAEGHIITNHHVVADKNSIRVTLHDQTTYEAKLIGYDKPLDIAVLRIQAEGPFPHLKFGDSDKVRVGQMVFAIGNPFGLSETVTQGIISAKERAISDTQRGLFQTDAAVNPGNSGGPLINVQGEVIGINAAIIPKSGNSETFSGVSFSIPINDAVASFKSILERGVPTRGFLGVVMADLSPRARHLLNYDGEFGAAVAEVTPGAPADLAGLEPLDIIMGYDGSNVENMDQLLKWVQAAGVGDEIEMKVWRRGVVLDLVAKIADASASATPFSRTPSANTPLAKPEMVLQKIGLKVRDITLAERARNMTGVIITQIKPNSIADSLGLKVGDEAVGIDGVPITHEADFYLRLAASAAVQPAELVFRREGKLIRMTIPAFKR